MYIYTCIYIYIIHIYIYTYIHIYIYWNLAHGFESSLEMPALSLLQQPTVPYILYHSIYTPINNDKLRALTMVYIYIYMYIYMYIYIYTIYTYIHIYIYRYWNLAHGFESSLEMPSLSLLLQYVFLFYIVYNPEKLQHLPFLISQYTYVVCIHVAAPSLSLLLQPTIPYILVF